MQIMVSVKNKSHPELILAEAKLGENIGGGLNYKLFSHDDALCSVIYCENGDVILEIYPVNTRTACGFLGAENKPVKAWRFHYPPKCIVTELQPEK